MTDLEKAKSLLTRDLTCVLVKGEEVITSDKSGIAPIMELIESGKDLNGFSVADRIVGKAAAMLFKKVGISEVFAVVISEPAKEYLKKNGLNFEFSISTNYIMNRTETGMCPMEETVKTIENFEDAYIALKEKLKELKNEKTDGGKR